MVGEAVEADPETGDMVATIVSQPLALTVPRSPHAEARLRTAILPVGMTLMSPTTMTAIAATGVVTGAAHRGQKS